jgi:formyltetrahydrofolate-dependent phosphoribosylglycinamide formyltransferase
MKRIGVLASGGGSNLQAILDHFAELGARAAAEVVFVASDRPQAGALVKARAAGVEAVVLKERIPDEEEFLALFDEWRVDYVALAGYLKLIPKSIVDRYANRMLNVHPALLPKHGGAGMYGMRVHQAVLNAGERVTGPTVHLVTHEYDSGPMLAQWPVGVLPQDDAPAVAARVLVAEHALYPRVLHALAAGERNRFPLRPDDGYYENPPITPEQIRRDIIGAFARVGGSAG